MDIKSDAVFFVVLLVVSGIVSWCLLAAGIIYRQHKALADVSALLDKSNAQTTTAIKTATECLDGAVRLVSDERSRREQAERDLWVCVEGLRWAP
jgi:hypothetical protein